MYLRLYRFKVYDIDDIQNDKKDYIGECITSIGKIFGSQR